MASSSFALMLDSEPDAAIRTSNVNPHVVTLRLGGGVPALATIYMSPAQARRAAAALLADAIRCEKHHFEQVDQSEQLLTALAMGC